MLVKLLILGASMATATSLAQAQPAVRVDASHLVAPRPLNEQTQSAAVRDYLESWQSMSEALTQNREDLLDADFVGAARERLGDAIHDQSSMNLSTRYQDRSHNIQVLFYSPEGLSIELADNAEYDVQVSENGKILATYPEHARYIVVLTPSEVRWRVRILQATSD